MLAKSSNFSKAVFFILLAILLFDLQGTIVKHMGDRYPIQQLATFRNIFGLLPSFLVLYFSAEWHQRGRVLRVRQWKLALSRGVMIAGAQFCLYLSYTKLEFATASTLSYIGPVLITVLSIPILKHSVGIWRWGAVIMGFFGVVLIMRPGTELFTVFALLPLCASLGYSLSTICVKLIDDSVPTALINMYSSVSSAVCTAVVLFATTGYIPINHPTDWLLLILMGLFGGFAVLSMITAYRLTEPSKLSPFEYFGIPFAFVLGWLIFGETPFKTLFPGVLFIVAGGLLIAWRESRKKNTGDRDQ